MLSKISVEFGIFFTLITTLENLGFIHITLLVWLVSIAVIVLFASIMAKFGVKIYKDTMIGVKTANSCISKTSSTSQQSPSTSGEETKIPPQNTKVSSSQPIFTGERQ